MLAPEHRTFSVCMRPSGSFDTLSDAFNRMQVATVVGALSISLFAARSSVSTRACVPPVARFRLTKSHAQARQRTKALAWAES